MTAGATLRDGLPETTKPDHPGVVRLCVDVCFWSARILVGVVSWRRPAAGKAFTAIHRLAGRRVERNFGLLTALGTGRRIQLAWRRAEPALVAVATSSTRGVTTATATARRVATTCVSAATGPAVALSLACLPAGWTTLRLGKTTLLIKFVLTQGEHEFLTAIAAGQRSITHPPEPLWPRRNRDPLERKQKRLTNRLQEIRHDDKR